jgi:hypothetical protein
VALIKGEEIYVYLGYNTVATYTSATYGQKGNPVA